MSKLKFFFLFLTLFAYGALYAGDTAKMSSSAEASVQAPSGKVEMADGLRAEGKIYVVVTVLLIILAGVLLYLISIDKKVSRIEKNIDADKERK